jgi:putative oxidoreductase
VISSVVQRFNPYTLSILRITAGFMFLQHGLQKFGLLEGRIREFPELTWFAGVIELLGGALIALGVFTRPVAFLTSGEMACAYFLSHAPGGFWPILNSGERSYLFCFIFLLIVTAGAGKFSVDAWLAKRVGPCWWM